MAGTTLESGENIARNNNFFNFTLKWRDIAEKSSERRINHELLIIILYDATSNSNPNFYLREGKREKL